jgi:OFA family oxalate/formate antiporter-like MFS transporter
MPLGVKIMKKANARSCSMIAGCAMTIVVYLSSYSADFETFTLIFAIGGGCIVGFVYMITVAHFYKYFPKKKGTVSGILIAGGGIGTFFFGLVAQSTINPHNLPLAGDYYG